MGKWETAVLLVIPSALWFYAPDGSNAFYYLVSDRLGSTRRVLTASGSAVPGSVARYLPFGDWRTEPTSNLTDRGFTGHLHNNLGNGANDLGLIYMNARYYVPYFYPTL